MVSGFRYRDPVNDGGVLGAHTAVRVWSCPLVDKAESQPRRCGGELIHPNTHTHFHLSFQNDK